MNYPEFFHFILNKKKQMKLIENFIIDPSFFALYRVVKDNKRQCLVNFHKEYHENNMKKIKKLFQSDKIYIYINDIYNQDCTSKANFIHNIKEDDSFPYFDFTKNPENVSLNEELEWNNIRSKAFIPNPNQDWDFFQMEWILRKWEAGFGFFDYDSSLILPTYPRDLMNNLIHPAIVNYYCRRYVNKFGLQNFKSKFSCLYLFYKSKLGKTLLQFFYEELTKPTICKKELIQKLHKIYHKTSSRNKFRIFLFYQNHSIQIPNMKGSFDIHKYILVFLSFHLCFFCSHFAQQRKKEIFDGIQLCSKNRVFLQFFKDPDSVTTEIKNIHDHLPDINSWLTKEHFKTVKTPLSCFIYHNWNLIRRNINLLDARVINFMDTQLIYGNNLQNLFPRCWIENFHKKDYIFDRSELDKKRKMK